jgi:hypothetical protein
VRLPRQVVQPLEYTADKTGEMASFWREIIVLPYTDDVSLGVERGRQRRGSYIIFFGSIPDHFI